MLFGCGIPFPTTPKQKYSFFWIATYPMPLHNFYNCTLPSLPKPTAESRSRCPLRWDVWLRTSSLVESVQHNMTLHPSSITHRQSTLTKGPKIRATTKMVSKAYHSQPRLCWSIWLHEGSMHTHNTRWTAITLSDLRTL